MKILINATNIGEGLSGLSVYTLSMLKELVKLDTENEYLVILNETAKMHTWSIEYPANFKVRYVTKRISPDYRTKGHILRLLYANYLGLRYRKHLIFSTSQMEAIIFRRNQVIIVQDVIPLMDRNYNKKQYHYYKYYLKFALKHMLAVFTPSEFTKNEILKRYLLNSDKVHVTPLGIQNIYYAEIVKENVKKEKFILYVGRIANTKNILRLLEAYNTIKDKIQEKLVIMGRGTTKYIDDIRAKGLLSDRITIQHDAKIEGILENYKKAALFVFPTLYEGFGLPPLEAMACGCPVVVSNTTSLPEVCGNAAVYVDPANVDSIAEGILKVLKDPKLRGELVAKGYERAKHFTWENTAKITLDIIKRFDK